MYFMIDMICNILYSIVYAVSIVFKYNHICCRPKQIIGKKKKKITSLHVIWVLAYYFICFITLNQSFLSTVDPNKLSVSDKW